MTTHLSRQDGKELSTNTRPCNLLNILCRSSKGLNLVPEILLNSQVMNTRMEESTFQKEANQIRGFGVFRGIEKVRILSWNGGGFCPGMVDYSNVIRDWKALLLDSGFKLGFIETTLFSLVDTIQTQLSCENVAVDVCFPGPCLVLEITRNAPNVKGITSNSSVSNLPPCTLFSLR
ncbi:hypothetical protein NC652_037009 [Populus alba x Populus x berolinensis]|nr:hypothetical protein NC652_037009 [Populus alba x Populus x berolinensis]